MEDQSKMHTIMDGMDIVIREATEQDFPYILQMIKDLADFERAPDAVTNTLERMHQEQHLFGCFMAELDGEIVGMALYFFAYYTWVGKSMYLDDLYVKPEHRGKKIGRRLLDRIIHLAWEQGCHRLRWQVLDWNVDAIEVYRRKGAAMSQEWINCQFDRAGLERLAHQVQAIS